VVVALIDQENNKIGQVNYNGTIGYEAMAVKNLFQAQKNYNWLKLIATVKNNQNEVVDTYETVYDCQAINPESCMKPMVETVKTGSNSKKSIVIIIIAIFLISSVLFTMIFIRRQAKKSSGTTNFLFLLLSAGILLSGFSGKALAYTCSDPGYNQEFNETIRPASTTQTLDTGCVGSGSKNYTVTSRLQNFVGMAAPLNCIPVTGNDRAKQCTITPSMGSIDFKYSSCGRSKVTYNGIDYTYSPWANPWYNLASNSNGTVWLDVVGQEPTIQDQTWSDEVETWKTNFINIFPTNPINQRAGVADPTQISAFANAVGTNSVDGATLSSDAPGVISCDTNTFRCTVNPSAAIGATATVTIHVPATEDKVLTGIYCTSDKSLSVSTPSVSDNFPAVDFTYNFKIVGTHSLEVIKTGNCPGMITSMSGSLGTDGQPIICGDNETSRESCKKNFADAVVNLAPFNYDSSNTTVTYTGTGDDTNIDDSVGFNNCNLTMDKDYVITVDFSGTCPGPTAEIIVPDQSKLSSNGILYVKSTGSPYTFEGLGQDAVNKLAILTGEWTLSAYTESNPDNSFFTFITKYLNASPDKSKSKPLTNVAAGGVDLNDGKFPLNTLRLINFRVQDEKSQWSARDSMKVMRVDNYPPTASIIYPVAGAIIKKGVGVKFQGKAQDQDGQIIASEWFKNDNCSGLAFHTDTVIPAQTYTSPDFTDNSFAVGDHTISYQVKDNQSKSTCVKGDFTVINCTPNVCDAKDICDGKSCVQDCGLPDIVGTKKCDGGNWQETAN